MTFLEIVLAIFFPPLAVGLRYGLGGKFFLNVFLTIIGIVPGVIHALVVLSRR